MIPQVNFGPVPTQEKIQNLSQQSFTQPQTSIPRNQFFEGVKKMQQAEGLDNTTALYKGLEYFKSQGKTIEGIDINSQLKKYQTQIEEQKAQEEDKGFFEAIGDVIKRRGDKGAEILIAGVKREGGQGKLESGIQYGANIIAGLADVAGTAVMEGLDAITPEAVQEKLKEGLQKAFETKGGEFVMGKLQEVNDNMETLRELNPRVARNFEAFGDTVNSFLTFYGGSQAKKGADALVGKVDDVVGGVDTLASRTATNIKQGIDDVGEAITTVGGKIGDATKQTAKGTFGQVYKLNQDTIEQAFKNPKLFTEAQKMGADDFIRETADKVQTAVKQRMDDLSELGKEYEIVRRGLKVSDDTEIGQILQKNLDIIPEKQLTKADRNIINDAISYVDGYKGEITDTDILSLRKQLDSIKFDPNTGLERKLSPQGNRIVTALRNDIDEIAKGRIEGLKALDDKFAGEIAEVNKLKGVIFDSKGNLKDRYIADVANLTGKGKELKIERIRQIIPDIDEKLAMYKALSDIDNAVQGFKVGTYQSAAGTAISGGIGALAGGPAGAIVGAVVYQMITNPKLGIEIIKKLSIANDIKNAILKKVKDGIKLKADEARALVQGVRSEINEQALKGKEALGGLVDDVADKVGARAKFMDDTGKSLDDFKEVGTTGSAKIRTVSDSVDLEKIKGNDRIISMLKGEGFDGVKNSRGEFIFPKEIKATIIEDIPKMDKSNMTPLQKRFDKYWGGYVENMEIGKVDDIYKNGKEMGLDNQEMAALGAYIRNEYFPLNQALRKGIKSDTKMNTLKKMIDEGLSKLPDYKGIVYREGKLPKEIVSQLDTGKSFTDKAYMSTSMSDDIVKDFKLPSTTKDYSVHYEIKTKTGKDISKINPSEEKEILIKPNTEFKITEIKKVNEGSYGDRIYIKAEEI